MTTSPGDPATTAATQNHWQPGGADVQRWLHRANRRILDTADYDRRLRIEQPLFHSPAAAYRQSAPAFGDTAVLLAALTDRLAEEESTVPTEADQFLAEQATPTQFQAVVAQYAVDGLIESQSHLAVLPRLPAPARMAVLRVLIDEFGGGHDVQEHARLYRDLLEELGLSTELDEHVEAANSAVLGYVNLFFWLAARAPGPEYFLGAYAYFESSVLYAFRSFAAAATRLGITRHRYFTEHLYIDTFHARQMQGAIAAMERRGDIDLAAVWSGVELASAAAGGAFAAVVAGARRVP